jgi:hypothetical protein
VRDFALSNLANRHLKARPPVPQVMQLSSSV